MREKTLKRYTKTAVKSLLALFFVGALSVPFLTGGLKDLGNPLSHEEITEFDSLMTKTFEIQPTSQDEVTRSLLSSIPDFVKTPEGGTNWDIFGETKQNPYDYTDKDGMDWSGVRPEFSERLKKLDGQEILIQGYMFPLDQTEQQSQFLLGPFPVSCPFHYHVTPNLIIEAHAKTPVEFSYDAIDIKGRLELVPKDDEYNVFYRLHDVEVIQ